MFQNLSKKKIKKKQMCSRRRDSYRQLPTSCNLSKNEQNSSEISRRYTKTDRKRADYIRSVFKLNDTLERVKTLKSRWIWHITKMDDDIWAQTALEWISRNLKKPKGRLPRFWDRHIRLVAVVNWKIGKR